MALGRKPGTMAEPVTLVKKICVLGDIAVGKTSLVSQFTAQRIEQDYQSTIGVVVSRKTVGIPLERQLVHVSLLVWDLTGDRLFEQLRQAYLHGTAGVLLVCDLTRPDTVAHLEGYAREVRAAAPRAVLTLVGNKADLPRQVPDSALELTTRSLAAPCQLTSALDGEGVERLFRQLALDIARGDPVYS